MQHRLMIKSIHFLILLLPFFGFSQDYESEVIIFKVKPQYKSVLSSDEINSEDFRNLFSGVDVHLKQMFPHSKAPVATKRSGLKLVDITTIYRLEFQNHENIFKWIDKLKSLELIDYAEPNYFSYPVLTPNDPDLALQYHLTNINAYGAWDIQQGSSSVRIAVVDAGTDIDHPDLVANSYINTADPINGIDDDGNGFVDDYYGWDFLDDDGIPDSEGAIHGVHVAGIATATPNNFQGIAGVAYNCTHVPVRVGNDAVISHGYEGIVYAADQGFDVINCSWGSFNFSEYAQDIVVYASLNQGALVVAASGNNGRDGAFYPAAYNYTLAVGATNESNEVTGFTNYGYWLDILAPGQSIYSTMPGGSYNYNSGTSMAAPVISGVAALVKSEYPFLSGLQIAERLKTTSTDVSNVGGNNSYGDKMGFGLVDAQSALSGIINEPSVVYEEIQISDENDEAFAIGDTIRIGGLFTNYLAASDSLSAIMTSSSTSIDFINDIHEIGVLPASGTTPNYTNPFTFVINSSAGMNDEIDLQITISDGNYEVVQYIEITVNVNFLNVMVNNVFTSVGGNSNIGIIDESRLNGLGVTLNGGSNQLYEGGFMVGLKRNNIPFVIDNIRNGQGVDQNFAADTTIYQIFKPETVDTTFQSYAEFSDLNGSGDSVGIKVTHEAFAFSSQPHANYVLLYYNMINQSQETFDSVYASVFMDWDINTYSQNKSTYDADYRLAYAYSTDGNAGYYGVQHLGEGVPTVYSFDNVNGGNGGIDIFNSFTTTQKYNAMKNGRVEGGTVNPSGNDIIQMTSVGPFSLSPGDTQQVIFSIVAANTLADIQRAADSAYTKIYGSSTVGIESIIDEAQVSIYPNPVNNTLRIQSTEKIKSVEVFSLSGAQMLSSANSNQVDVSGLKSGIYIVRVETNLSVVTQKLIKQP